MEPCWPGASPEVQQTPSVLNSAMKRPPGDRWDKGWQGGRRKQASWRVMLSITWDSADVQSDQLRSLGRRILRGKALASSVERWIGVQENMEQLTYLTRRQFVGWAKEFQFVLEGHSYEGCPLRRAQYQS